MNDQLLLHEEECVTLCLPGSCYHFLHLTWRQLGEIIDHLESVSSVRYAEPEFELK